MFANTTHLGAKPFSGTARKLGLTLMTFMIALWMAVPLQSWAASTQLTIIHFSDLSQVEAGHDGRGGLAKLTSLIKSQRALGKNVLVTFAGDGISPSLLSVFDQGAHIIDLFNRLGLTAMTLGNHEFDFGPDVTRQRVSEAQFPILSANSIDSDGELVDGTQAHILVDVDGFKVGFFGLTTSTTATKSIPGDVIFRPVTEVAAEQAKALRDSGAHLVIALAHTDASEDQELLDQGVVDMILSGDDHKLQIEYDQKALFVESGEQAQQITLIELTLNETEKEDSTKVFTWYPGLQVVDTEKVTPDPEMAKAVQVYMDQLSQELDVEIGTTLTPLDSRRVTIRSQEAAISNLIADAVREVLGADIFISNTGGIRGNRLYEANATLTRRDVFTELPFHNKGFAIEVTGADILAALEHSLGTPADKLSGRFPHVSGLSVLYDSSHPPGQRIVRVVTDQGQPLDPDKTYKLATSSFLEGGGDGYEMFANKKRLSDTSQERLLSLQVIEYILRKKTISPKVEGRIQLRVQPY